MEWSVYTKDEQALPTFVGSFTIRESMSWD